MTERQQKKTKVLAFIETYRPVGPGKNLIRIIPRLKPDFEIHVATYTRGSSNSPFTHSLQKFAIPHVVLQERFRYDWDCLRQITRAIQVFQPDILQFHNAKSRLYALWLKKRGCIGNTPCVAFIHGVTWEDHKQRFYNALDQLLIKKFRYVVTVSKEQKQHLMASGVPDKHIHCIPNAIELPSALPKKNNSIFHFLSVGRLSREKGHIVLLKAALELLKTRKDFCVSLLGDGREMSVLKNFVSRHPELTTRIHFEGFQHPPEQHYINADVFVLPSLSEGIPNVLLEAAAYRLPIIASHVGGIPEIFSADKEALLVKANSPKVLARAMLRCMTEPDIPTALSHAARHRVEKDFCLKKRAERLCDFYRHVLS